MSAEPEATTMPEATTGPSRRRMLTGLGAVAGAGLVAVAGAQPAQAATTDGGLFFSEDPVRFLDTRNAGGPLSAGQTRTVPVSDGAGLTLFFNLTVVSTVGNGYLAVFDSDRATRPSPFSSVNWQGAGKIVANFGLVSVGTTGFKVYCGGSAGTKTNFIVDIVGVAEAPPAAAVARAKELRRRLLADATG